MSYLVARQKCGCVATALFYPLEDGDSLKSFIAECIKEDYIIETRQDNQTISAKKCLDHTSPPVAWLVVLPNKER